MTELDLIIAVLLFICCILLFLMILVRQKFEEALTKFSDQFVALEKRQGQTDQLIKFEITKNREETAGSAKSAREELSKSLKDSSDSLLQRMTENAGMQKNQLDFFSRQLTELTHLNEEKLETIRKTVEHQLQNLQGDTSNKLEQMRATVDEKLHSTLEKRLGESFNQVSERLEQVYKGLGEMRTLATGVGDLKKVLTNVKTRGTWGEIQLGNILEQILTPDQYDRNVSTKKDSNARVEFALKLPGPDSDPDTVVWMPIDSKFPQEDYQRLMDAQEIAAKELAEKSIKNLEMRIKSAARDIKEKYIDPPNTTDFGIMFLPVEGLYAEVLRRPGLCDFLQREYRIVVTGPTTLAALLNSLQMGFRTLAIERRSSEVWELLSVVKTQFGKFGDMLAKTKKKLQEASQTIDNAEVRTRAIERKLRAVQEIPETDAEKLIEKEGNNDIHNL
ncbi:MAG: DNA recombination protein RmuC [Deltaproteobacteria bacterium]|nr:DNA recombination protein RmuC [Deltaproteobacteria bacterium]MBW2201932.1 DNA recombination protein RmuC [Deltaproteobacteria bacterium]MBW2538504.1 DNA recombination protein RmuC [Deltaproteobacteria bacterium]